MPMFDLYNNPITLRCLQTLALARGFWRYRNPYRREAWRHRAAFYERVWREAAEELDAEWLPLGSGIAQISLDDIRTCVSDNTCAIDDPVTLAILSDKPLTYRLLEQESLPTPA